MRIIKSLIFIPIILTLNSCFLAITGTPHNHKYQETNNKNDLTLDVTCMYLNKTFVVGKVNPTDSIIIKSTSFESNNKKNILLQNNISDSIRFYNWRIGDGKYHKNISNDTIEIFRITKDGNKNLYQFTYKSQN